MTGNVPDAVIENTHAHSSPPVTWSFQNGGRAPFAPMPGSATAGLSQRPKSTQRLGTRLRGRTGGAVSSKERGPLLGNSAVATGWACAGIR